MAMLPGGQSKGMSPLTKVALACVGLLGLYTLINPIISAAIALVNKISAGLELLALPVGLGAVLVGLLVFISPWHRRHGIDMVIGGVVACFGGGLAKLGLTWLHSGTGGVGLTFDGIQAGAQIIGAIFTGIRTGIGH
ncbi:MAG TPA: hypothetical protein VGG07_14280 [Solirubrobacteraceae bacterium]|jgi:hydrogenase-4 membrane subunit HyfE